jgi:hypothetical protein
VQRQGNSKNFLCTAQKSLDPPLVVGYIELVLHCSKTFDNPTRRYCRLLKGGRLPGDDVHGEQAKDD